jgi:protein-L-isoaspartate(D-aspartate) O-methyltransferase
VPFGANVIVGHPGETEASMRTSAKYLSELFLGDKRGTMGFLSVDPFRLYPGSPIDEERAEWEAATGMKVHRPECWHDGDQDFLSEWVDPSGELDFRTTHRLRHELFSPILHGIKDRYAYQGPARDYFMRSITEQIAFISPRRQLRTLGLHHLWQGLVSDTESPADRRRVLANDTELTEIARATREEKLPQLPYRDALIEVPRERFVREDDLPQACDDRALPLDAHATISAMHAYAMSFSALDLAPGDDLVELGGGSGYGAAVAATIVGATGRVTTIEIDPALSALARELVGPYPSVTVHTADALDVSLWRGARKVSVAFAVERVPSEWLDAIAPGGVLVAPVASKEGQSLMRIEKSASGAISERAVSRVLYVRDRSPVAVAGPAE